MTAVLVLAIVGLLAVPTSVRPGSGGLGSIAFQPSALGMHQSSAKPQAASAHPAAGFPRTVLVESFTGVWCIHCPAESQALYVIDHQMSRSVVGVAELHACAFPPGSGPCLENYVPSDGTMNSRGTFYPVCGYPDVYFDGGHDSCGASNSEPQMQAQYESAIANSSAIPGNVSISQSATIQSGTVVDHSNITSALNGNYNTVTYILEYIGKRNVSNGYGPHDIGNVVRKTLYNHPVTLVNGLTTEVNATSPLNTSWKIANLSVVTLVQENSTRIVENANWATVSTLTTAVKATPTTLPSGNSTAISIRIANSSTNVAISGAAVSLTSSGGGSFSPASGTSASDGTFTSTFTAPLVSSTQLLELTAQVTASGYTTGSGVATVLVTPLIPPSAPTGLYVTPAVQQVSLGWLPPFSGGNGVSYTVYRSTSQGGSYLAAGISSTPQFVDMALAPGQSYWYKVNAHGPGGFSANTTPVSASSVTAVSQGLPPTLGWWLTVGTFTFNSSTNASLSMYLAEGYYTYTYGPDSYAFVASGQLNPFTTSGTTISFLATFTPRWATIEGSVSPASATVTLNGTALTVVDGSYLALRAAGKYTLEATASGYQTKFANVTLTPGNTTPQDLLLQSSQSGTGSQGGSNGGLSSAEMLGIVGGVVAVAAVLGAALVISKRRGRARGSEPEAEPQQEN
ncbi:MAG: hypothetical protein L3K13_07320 [Thermoplasmata archaeon]|nr:hypothetical protein [Thermoplasmata archaeon]